MDLNIDEILSARVRLAESGMEMTPAEYDLKVRLVLGIIRIKLRKIGVDVPDGDHELVEFIQNNRDDELFMAVVYKIASHIVV